MTVFKLRFPVPRIEHWAGRSSDPVDDEVERVIAPRTKRLGYLRKPDFLRLCRWKTPRSRPNVEKNSETFIEAVTATAFSTPEERLRIEALTLLDGVHWPTASVILHFGHREPYPILDVRALWSLGIETPPAYAFEFWWEYTKACRRLADRHGCSMRTLDRALWQYAKERQGAARTGARR
jgi:hypothetical protein